MLYKFKNQFGKLLIETLDKQIDVNFESEFGILCSSKSFPFSLHKESQIIKNVEVKNFDELKHIYEWIFLYVTYQENDDEYIVRYDFSIDNGLSTVVFLNETGINDGPRNKFAFIDMNPITYLAQIYKDDNNSNYLKLLKNSNKHSHITLSNFHNYIDACVLNQIQPRNVLKLQEKIGLSEQYIIDIICNFKILWNKYIDKDRIEHYQNYVDVFNFKSDKNVLKLDNDITVGDFKDFIHVVVTKKIKTTDIEDLRSCAPQNESSKNKIFEDLVTFTGLSEEKIKTISSNYSRLNTHYNNILRKTIVDLSNINKRNLRDDNNTDNDDTRMSKRIKINVSKSIGSNTIDKDDETNTDFFITDKVNFKDNEKNVIFSIQQDSFKVVSLLAYHATNGHKRGNGILFDHDDECFKRFMAINDKQIIMLERIENKNIITEYLNRFIVSRYD